ncbi:hypothetical protein IKF76_01085 [Candidatus Saccharibacteria bacterium]|nr:hypothetical protein [Candidatus Saccharibacteria bacterium]
MSDIIIRDDLGRSKRYTPTKEGYHQAQTDINSLRQQGRIVSGDVGRVESYTGGPPPQSASRWW